MVRHQEVAFLLSVVLLGCGTGGDTTIEDNRVCITNDSFNNQPINNIDFEITEAAEEQGLEVVETVVETPPAFEFPPLLNQERSVAVCGTNAEIQAAIGNGDDPLLSDFLAGGQQT